MKLKKTISILLLLSIFLINGNDTSYARFPNGYPTEEIEVSPSGLAYKKQTVKVTVKGQSDPRPKTVWTQTDTDRWEATINGGAEQIYTGTHGSGYNAVPTKQMVRNKINTFNYAPKSMRDKNNNPFKRDKVKQLGIEDINYIKDSAYEPLGAKPEFQKGKIFATLKTYTGYPLQETKKVQYGWRADGAPKFNVHYNTPLEIHYIGYVQETKELKVTGNAILKKGETKQLKAEVRTQEYDMNGFSDPVDVTRRDQTIWSSDNKKVATVDETGLVKAEGKGTAKITAKWKRDPYYIYDTVTITVDDKKPTCKPGEPGCDDNEEPPPGGVCTPPQPGRVISGKYMDPVATAVIKADQRGNERFDVLQGIPTSESLYGNILARNYLFQNNFVNMTGTCTFNVNVEKTWTLTWDPGKTVTGADGKTKTVPDPQVDQEPVQQTHQIVRPYSFWVIDNLEVYKIDQGTLRNYALPGGEVTIYPEGYEEPKFTAEQTGNFYPPENPGTVTAPGGTKNGGKSRPSPPNENLKSHAEKAVGKVQVTNDSLEFNNQTIMNGERVEETGATPGNIPAPTHIGPDVLYSSGHIISSDKINKANTASNGTINYGLMPGNMNGGSNQEFPIYEINTVTVHTPVVNYSSVTDDQAHNQKTNPNPDRAAFILERPFTVRIPTNGQHTNYPGYRNRDYAKYFRTKQVKFPFDTYNSSRTIFYPKNTWIDIPVHQLDTEFFLPVWVDEGDYQVEFRNIAENAPANFTQQPKANLDLMHHVATEVEPVEVIGRVYDFRITDIADYNWQTVFRTHKGSAVPKGNAYWTGQRDIDGAPRGNPLPYTLPIAPGKHPQPGYKNVSVKTGYHFKFDLKTKGNMFSAKDGIAITPSFYFVKKDGTGRIPVDLYYHSSSRNFVRIGSPEDKEKRYVILNERLRNVPLREMQDTASYMYNHSGASRQMSPEAFAKQYIERISRKRTWIGRYDWLLLPSEIRTLIGPKAGLPASVDPERANASIQRWYGEYSIPSDVYVVKKGTNLAEYGRGKGIDEKSDVFLKDGFIVVNFNIETIQNGNLTRPHLQYIDAPLMNQWKLEGFSNTYIDPYGSKFSLKDGDAVFYHADQSSKKDFSSQVPH
ncbi:DUF5704 domain-containing protein [Paenibacillus faecalis]|uniref:DUF5704 domain-containing protein n=1 Tax=Paenibacillus faecalis TaxID=2079532 RepID=UPI000D0F2E86|nr:DUF5704 domain-containing protein [Paenibacillus faecalis]